MYEFFKGQHIPELCHLKQRFKSDLLIEDVLNNQSFITAMAFPLAKIKEFIASEEKYSSKQDPQQLIYQKQLRKSKDKLRTLMKSAKKLVR